MDVMGFTVELLITKDEGFVNTGIAGQMMWYKNVYTAVVCLPQVTRLQGLNSL